MGNPNKHRNIPIGQYCQFIRLISDCLMIIVGSDRNIATTGYLHKDFCIGYPLATAGAGPEKQRFFNFSYFFGWKGFDRNTGW